MCNINVLVLRDSIIHAQLIQVVPNSELLYQSIAFVIEFYSESCKFMSVCMYNITYYFLIDYV